LNLVGCIRNYIAMHEFMNVKSTYLHGKFCWMKSERKLSYKDTFHHNLN